MYWCMRAYWLLPPWFFSLTSIFLSGWELASIMIHPLNKNLLYYSIDIKTGNMQGLVSLKMLWVMTSHRHNLHVLVHPRNWAYLLIRRKNCLLSRLPRVANKVPLHAPETLVSVGKHTQLHSFSFKSISLICDRERASEVSSRL